jgi:hypothetical protein
VLEDRALSNGTAWPRASATASNAEGTASTEPDGLLQLMAENEIATTLWLLSRTDANAVLAAMSSPRMLTPGPNRRFERGYFTQVYTRNADGTYRWTRSTSTASSVFPDYLDALACGGFSRERMTEVLAPAMHYPFPVANPLCR